MLSGNSRSRAPEYPCSTRSPAKAHVGADADTALVEEIAITPANINDGKAGPDALPDDPGEVFADSAYRGNHFGDAVRAKGGTPRIVATGMWGRDEAVALKRLDAWNRPIHRMRGSRNLRNLEAKLRPSSNAMARMGQGRRPCPSHRHRLQPQTRSDDCRSGMTITTIIDEAAALWPVADITVHRHEHQRAIENVWRTTAKHYPRTGLLIGWPTRTVRFGSCDLNQINLFLARNPFFLACDLEQILATTVWPSVRTTTGYIRRSEPIPAAQNFLCFGLVG